jgi:hypothetical protein
MMRISRSTVAIACSALALGCAVDPDDLVRPIVPVGPPMLGLHVVGNHIENEAGETVILRGVNRSGTEYKCVQSGGIFDGPSDMKSIQAMTDWRVNAVRVPLNESCWLGINGVSPSFGGENYKKAIIDYVALLHQLHMVPILELHWVGPGTTPADRLHPMPDADHARDFWIDMANTFAADSGVVFELFNEPFPDGNRDTEAAWQCWRDGCTANLSVPRGQPAVTYQAIGMQGLVDAVRSTGSKHLILVGGIEYSNALTGWSRYAPTDPAGNTAAAWHIYNFNRCAAPTCWDGVPATLAATVPIVVTEFGQNDCGGAFIGPLASWLDAHGIGYLAWSWNAYGACRPDVMGQRGQPWSLITNYDTGTPNSAYAQAYFDHLQAH